MVNLVASPDVFGSTIFCDDVRIESTGKLIYIGVYQGVMAIHVPFPVRLSTFAFSISFSQRKNIFDPRITYRVFLPGDPDDASSDEASIVAEMEEVSPGDIAKQAGAMSDAMGVPPETREFVRSFANLNFQAFELKEPGMMKVRADIGGNRYRIGNLSVVAAPKPQT